MEEGVPSEVGVVVLKDVYFALVVELDLLESFEDGGAGTFRGRAWLGGRLFVEGLSFGVVLEARVVEVVEDVGLVEF